MKSLGILTILLGLLVSGCSSKKIEKPKDKGDGVSVEKPVASSDSPSTSSSESGTATPKKANFKGRKKVVCSGIQEERIIEVSPTDEGGCVTLYTKFGETHEKARALNETHICESVLDKIATNLANAGFNCQ